MNMSGEALQANSLYCVGKKYGQKTISIPYICTKPPEVYPRAWLDAHPGKKPSIPIYHPCTSAQAYATVYAELRRHVWTDRLVCTFMRAVMEENPEIFQIKADDKWSADGRVIAEQKGASVTPLSLLGLDVEAPLENYLIEDDSTKETRLSLFYAVLSLYRKTIERASHGVGRRLDTFFQGPQYGVMAEHSNTVAGLVADSSLTCGYRALISAIDMFFHKFSSATFSEMRIATLPSRYRGCGCLVSWGYISDLAGKTSQDLALYIMTTSVANDLKRILKPNQGAEDVFGYFPYHVELGLSSRSAYSVRMNPTLHLWLHTLGTILGSRRSAFAKFSPGALDQVSTINSAVAVGLTLIKGGGNRRQQLTQTEAERDELRGIKREAEVQPVEEEQLPLDAESKMANDILKSLLANKGLSDEQKVQASLRVREYRGILKDTIGYYLAGISPLAQPM